MGLVCNGDRCLLVVGVGVGEGDKIAGTNGREYGRVRQVGQVGQVKDRTRQDRMDG